MKDGPLLEGSYELPAGTVQTLKNHWLKAIGGGILLLALYLVAVTSLGVRSTDSAAWIIDLVFVLSLLLFGGSYSRGYASLRVALARHAETPEERIALLIPFVGRKATFDPDGEAFSLLLQAAEQCKETRLEQICRDRLKVLKRGSSGR